MTAVKHAACSKAAVRRHQTTCRLSPRRVLDNGMTHVIAPDERRRRLASGADLHASERYDGAQPCSDLNINVASLKSTRRRTGSQCNSCRTGEMSSRRPVRVINLAAALCTDCSLVHDRARSMSRRSIHCITQRENGALETVRQTVSRLCREPICIEMFSAAIGK